MAGTGSSVNDPVFYLHHRNIDRIWKQWQDTNPLANSYERASLISNQMSLLSDVMSFQGLGKDMSVFELINTTSQNLCFTYSRSITVNTTISLSRRDYDYSHVSGLMKRSISNLVTKFPLAIDWFNRNDKNRLRKPSPIEEQFLKRMYKEDDIKRIRLQESFMEKLSLRVNADSSYLSHARIGNLEDGLKHGFIPKDESLFLHDELRYSKYLNLNKSLCTRNHSAHHKTRNENLLESAQRRLIIFLILRTLVG
jgi:hypothetical protein